MVWRDVPPEIEEKRNRLNQWGTDIAREHGLEIEIDLRIDDAAPTWGVHGEVIPIERNRLTDPRVSCTDLRVWLAHEIGHVKVRPLGLRDHPLEHACDAFSAQVLGADAVIASLRQWSVWGADNGEDWWLTGSESHPSLQARISHVESLGLPRG